MVFVSNSSSPSGVQMKGPQYVAVNVNGTRIAVSCYLSHSVHVFTDDQSQVFTFGTGTNGTSTNELNHPHGIVFDDENRLYIADRNNERIVVLSPNGSFLRSFPSLTSTGDEIQPVGLALSDTKLYVTQGTRENPPYYVSTYVLADP